MSPNTHLNAELSALVPKLEKELKENILGWWMKYSPDKENGGFHGHIDHRNRVVQEAPKGAIMHARILWTFSAAFRMEAREEYLETAARAYEYIQQYFLDPEYGGVYWELDHSGKVLSDKKQIYALAFTLYAFTEYYHATREKEALETAIGLFVDIEDHAFDLRRNGYTDALSRQWEPVEDLRLSEKDQNESKTMNTHLHILEAYTNLYRAWRDPRLEAALANLVDLFLEKFINRDLHLNLFFDDDWNLRSDLISYGHDIECSWLLHEATEVLKDPVRLDEAEHLAVAMARKNMEGMDEDGGLAYEYMPSEKHMDWDKHWWPQAEALVGYYNAFRLSGDEELGRKVLRSWDFIRNSIVDHKHGEWVWSTDREGNAQTFKEKAGFWKCPYHNGRACMELIRRISANS